MCPLAYVLVAPLECEDEVYEARAVDPIRGSIILSNFKAARVTPEPFIDIMLVMHPLHLKLPFVDRILLFFLQQFPLTLF